MPSQPKGLYVLFLAELWERYGFYTTVFLIVLYATDRLGMSDAEAAFLFGTYTAFIYATTVPGGILADRLMGFRPAILAGSALMACGCFLMAAGPISALYFGLAFVLVGNGFFKPNVSSLLGLLYAPKDARRDSGFTLFYVGINIGAGAAALGSGYIVRLFGYEAAFLVAGVAHCLSIASILAGGRFLEGRGLPPPERSLMRVRLAGIPDIAWLASGIAGAILLAYLLLRHGYATGEILAVICVVCIAYFLREVWTLGPASRRNAAVMLFLFCFGVAFWALYNLADDTVLLFIQRLVDRDILGHDVPPTAFLSLNEVFIICGAPLMAWVWSRVAAAAFAPSDAGKFALGLFLMGGAYLVLRFAAAPDGSGGSIAPAWIVLFYVLFSVGELCVAPIGLSMVSRLSPKQLLGFGMGMWFLVHSLGNYGSGLLAQLAAPPPGTSLEDQRALDQSAFQDYGLLAIGAALFLLASTPLIARFREARQRRAGEDM